MTYRSGAMSAMGVELVVRAGWKMRVEPLCVAGKKYLVLRFTSDLYGAIMFLDDSMIAGWTNESILIAPCTFEMLGEEIVFHCEGGSLRFTKGVMYMVFQVMHVRFFADVSPTQ